MNKNINVFIKNKKWLFRMADRIGKYAVRYTPKAIYERIEVDVNFPGIFGIPAKVILQDLQWERRPWVHDFVKKYKAISIAMGRPNMEPSALPLHGFGTTAKLITNGHIAPTTKFRSWLANKQIHFSKHDRQQHSSLRQNDGGNEKVPMLPIQRRRREEPDMGFV